jgi:hypothetical protein
MSMQPGPEAIAQELNLLDGLPTHPLLPAYSHGNMLRTSRRFRIGVLPIMANGHRRAGLVISNKEGNCNWHT